MERKMYAVCPCCGRRATITKFIWSWDDEQDLALIKCECGSRSQMPYAEHRVLHIDIDDPYVKNQNDTHFDLLIPQGWNEKMWKKVRACISHY